MYYKLDEVTKHVVPCEINELKRGADQFQLKTYLFGKYYISTVFLMFDHNYIDKGPPVVFETMVFPTGEWSELYMDRCCTVPQAYWMHIKGVCWTLKQALKDLFKNE